MRKLGAAFIALMPIAITITAILGMLSLTKFHLNVLTANMSAIAVGVGVDYSIHVTDRFRKEKATGKNFEQAMHGTVFNSGAALVFSALTTTFGFLVLLFAPMPMFFSFGLFSGLMVLMALLASVIIVPPLIKLVIRDKTGEQGKSDKKLN